MEKHVSAVLVAAGSSTRMGFDKLSFDLGGETVLRRSIRAFEQSPLVSEIVLVAGKNRAFVEAAGRCLHKARAGGGRAVPPAPRAPKTVCWPPMESWWLSTMRLAPL